MRARSKTGSSKLVNVHIIEHCLQIKNASSTAQTITLAKGAQAPAVRDISIVLDVPRDWKVATTEYEEAYLEPKYHLR